MQMLRSHRSGNQYAAKRIKEDIKADMKLNFLSQINEAVVWEMETNHETRDLLLKLESCFWRRPLLNGEKLCKVSAYFRISPDCSQVSLRQIKRYICFFLHMTVLLQFNTEKTFSIKK